MLSPLADPSGRFQNQRRLCFRVISARIICPILQEFAAAVNRKVDGRFSLFLIFDSGKSLRQHILNFGQGKQSGSKKIVCITLVSNATPLLHLSVADPTLVNYNDTMWKIDRQRR